MFEQVVYLDDKRYAGPACHPPPAEVKGLPTQRELDAFPRMFTWGELKDIIQRGDLEALMRNKPMQSRYDEWMVGMKVQYGSTENYLRTARLPWTSPSAQSGSSTSKIGTLAQSDNAEPAALPPGLAPSTVPAPGRALDALSTVATPGGGPAGRGAGSASGAATPSSAGFVSLASLKLVNGKLRRAKGKVAADQGGSASAEASGSSSPGTGSGSASPRGGVVENGPAAEPSAHEGKDEAGEDEEEGEGDDEPPVYLRYDAEQGLDTDKYAVLYNDWPYNVPYGVSHHCVWSRVPIAHPELVDYDPEAWARIEQEGLGGFTGITPLRSFRIPSPPSSAGLPSPPAEPAEPVDPNAPSPPSTANGTAAAPSRLVPEIVFTQDMVGRQKYIGRIREKDWYAADIAYSGPEARRWAGVGYMAKGGQEIDKMVRGLWDERGWECLWFVNPPRLQSVPGFSHFHVFARRKTPQEIDASEAFWDNS